MDKFPVRVILRKYGRAVYISHLDLLRTMQRALARSGLPVWYSEGFNPRIYLNFPLPLSLGTAGEREPMDFYGTEDIPMSEFAGRLSMACPEGIDVLSAAAPVHKNRDIAAGEYVVTFSGDIPVLRSAFGDFTGQDRIEVIKRSKKKGETVLDIKPHIDVRNISCGGELEVRVVLPAGNELNINAAVLAGAFIDFCRQRDIAAELLCAKRTNIYCENGEIFI